MKSKRQVRMLALICCVLLASALSAVNSEPVTITFSYWGSAHEHEIWTEVLEAFAQQHPDIRVDPFVCDRIILQQNAGNDRCRQRTGRHELGRQTRLAAGADRSFHGPEALDGQGSFFPKTGLLSNHTRRFSVQRPTVGSTVGFHHHMYHLQQGAV